MPSLRPPSPTPSSSSSTTSSFSSPSPSPSPSPSSSSSPQRMRLRHPASVVGVLCAHVAVTSTWVLVVRYSRMSSAPSYLPTSVVFLSECCKFVSWAAVLARQQGEGGRGIFFCVLYIPVCHFEHYFFFFYFKWCNFFFVCVPNQQRWYAEWELGQNMYTMHARFCTFWHRFAMLSRCLVCLVGAQSEVH